MYKSLISLSVIAALTGCATVEPTALPSNLPGSSSKKALEYVNEVKANPAGFNQVDPVEVQGQKDVILQAPSTIPEWIAKKRVTLKLQPGMSLKALAAYLGMYQNIPIVISEGAQDTQVVATPVGSGTTPATSTAPSTNGDNDQANANNSFFLPYYKGTMGEFLNIVGDATNTWITWKNGAITFSAREKVTIVVPQNEELIKQLQESIKTYGVNDVSYSLHAGLLTAKLKPSQYKEVKQMLESFVKNTAAVKLQVAVVTVTQDENVKQGINWDQLQIAASSGGNLSSVFPSIKAPTTGTATGTTTGTTTGATTGATTGTTSGTATDTAAAVLANTVAGALANKSGATWGIIGKQFNMTGMINYLRTYGQANTSQNMLLQGMTGSEVTYKSVKEVPYISEISSTSVASNSTTTTGSTKTDKAKDGVTLKMLPRYDAESNIVSIKFNLSQQGVLGLIELSAGNQLGKITQPSTSDSSLENSMLELRPGDAAIIGGLTFDSISRNNEAPLFLADTRAESKSLVVKRQTMYIVVMPYVSRLGKFKEQIPVPQDDEKMKAATLQKPTKVIEIDQKEEIEEPTPSSKHSKKIIRKTVQ